MVRLALLFAAFAVALLVRSVFTYDYVFQPDGVHIQEGDGYFHMRTVRNLLHHFPLRSSFDPYSGMPEGQAVTTGPFYDLAIGLTALIAGLGSPSDALINQVGAWFPAVLGALVTVLVYFIARTLFSPAAGLLAAGVVAIIPGNFMRVTKLGFTDHHVAETFLATLALMFLVLALARDDSRKRWLYTALAGLSLGCYLDTRPVGAFLVGFIAFWAAAQCFWDHMSGTPNRSSIVVAPALFIAWLLFLPLGSIIWSEFTLLALWGGIALILATWALSHWIHSRWLFALVLVLAVAAGIGILQIARPELLKSLLFNITSRQGEGPATTVLELRPLYNMRGAVEWKPMWEQFAGCWFLGIPALFFLAKEAWRENRAGLNLFLAWSVFMLVLGVQQNRNCYYLAVNMALLTGWTCWRVLSKGRAYERAVAAAMLAGVLIIPSVTPIMNAAGSNNGLSSDWISAYQWLHEKTPEPLGSPKAYDSYFAALPPGAKFTYPPSAYGVMNWWDYGHSLSAEAHRIPVSNGMQTGATEAARFFTSTSPAEAGGILQKMRARYIIAGPQMMVPQSPSGWGASAQFLAMPIWTHTDPKRFADLYLERDADGGTHTVSLYFPEYYRSMLAHLYLYDGEATPQKGSAWIIGYHEEKTKSGLPLRYITTKQEFATWQEAEARFQKIHDEPFVLAGLDATQTCVPLEKLKGYRLAFTSQQDLLNPRSSDSVHAVKVFEYQPE
jgi:dolichyl-phosphooligosaccharide-protein glycotransferase